MMTQVQSQPTATKMNSERRQMCRHNSPILGEIITRSQAENKIVTENEELVLSLNVAEAGRSTHFMEIWESLVSKRKRLRGGH